MRRDKRNSEEGTIFSARVELMAERYANGLNIFTGEETEESAKEFFENCCGKDLTEDDDCDRMELSEVA